MASERYTGLSSVLDAIRRQGGITQSALIEQVGLGRSVVAERVNELEEAHLIVTSGRAPSTGGRAPKLLTLNAQRGTIVVVDIADTELIVSAADLAGNLMGVRHRETIDVTLGPRAAVARIHELIEMVLGVDATYPEILAIGVGLPGPVNFDSGRPVDVPILPGWENFPIREEISSRWNVPVWVDDRFNLLALAEIVSNPHAAQVSHLLYFGAGIGNGAALIIDGDLYRGAHGLAGTIGHIAVPDAGMVVCRCGKVGCLEAVTSGWAFARDGLVLAASNRSPYLARVLDETGEIRAYDITLAAEAGDEAAIELLTRSSALLGRSIAPLVSFVAPQMVIIGGGIARAGKVILDPISAMVRTQLPAAAAAGLKIELATLDEQVGGVLGAAQLVVSQLYRKENLPTLLQSGDCSSRVS